MKIVYENWKPHKASLLLVAQANEIIEEYAGQGYILTLRQLYYQFVARDIIPNNERSYKNLGNIVTKGRMAGMISWYGIEDRNRGHHGYWVEEDPAATVSELPDMIAFDYWERQPYYLEVWVEKEALGNVIAKACTPWRVPYLSCKGYLSASEAWRAGQRFEDKITEGKKCVLVHLGDHDPSGIDMTRDNRERVDLFSNCPGEVDVRRIALNMDQIRKYKPPRNPTKLTDSRATGYIDAYGRSSWELDALEPKVIQDLIQQEIDNVLDVNIWNQVEAEEDEVKEFLGKFGSNWSQVEQFVRGLD